ncbi:MAG TPA: sigma-70 family RNA polymerase sigma factor [Leptolyngbyaceae cyanobacterium M33_DOE_097]|uniref:Sigma-70 family RNA polymerase sigma factor n=1 Tax=Oscillatoriales cyanobacterium SpSt-418 TaxID=2282169 RepID=A0A7C3PET7_9CYAN|nr:sigma-70 family RNA polymerase sigma factor [Leptolyngbyaceae cyanobacterium M33_DOE_097]
MTDLQELRRLVIQACQHPVGSPLRQRYLTQVIRLVSPNLWREPSPYYADALQQTWVYFCQNICDRGTGERYNPDRSSVVTWLNYYLKRRLQDFHIYAQQQQQRYVSPRPGRSGEVSDTFDPLDQVAAEPDVPPILERVWAWAQADATGELCQTHIEGRPDVSCQVLILRRLPPETSWKDLSTEFGLPIPTLSSFYQRKCLPRLRKFGESEGYV